MKRKLVLELLAIVILTSCGSVNKSVETSDENTMTIEHSMPEVDSIKRKSDVINDLPRPVERFPNKDSLRISKMVVDVNKNNANCLEVITDVVKPLNKDFIDEMSEAYDIYTWTDTSFLLDGKTLNFEEGLNEAVITSLGWGLENEQELHNIYLDSDEYITSLLYKNPEYDDIVKLYVDYHNPTEEKCDIAECEITSLEYDITSKTKMMENCGQLSIGGIGTGSSISSIEKVFGSPDGLYVGDKSETYEYGSENIIIKFRTSAEEGIIRAVELQRNDLN